MIQTMTKAKKKRRSVPEVNMDIFAKHLSDYLHKTRNFEKTKAEIADELGVSLSTYLLYERGEPGPKGVQLSFLAAVAKRNDIPFFNVHFLPLGRGLTVFLTHFFLTSKCEKF